MPREFSLYQWLKAGAPEGCILERIENSVSIGFPDIVGIYLGTTFVVETKVYPKRLTPKQASFLRRWSNAGGYAWVLFQLGQERYLVHPDDCLMLLGPITRGQLRTNCSNSCLTAAEFVHEIVKFR